MNTQNTTTTTHAAPVDDSTEIAVINPEDPHGAPLYEGIAAEAEKHLVAGEYVAVNLYSDERVEYTLVIAAEVRLFAKA